MTAAPMTGDPMTGKTPGVLADWCDRLREANARGTALQLRGGGTKAFYGQSPQGEVFDTRDYRGIVAFEPTELVVTARCGTPLAEVQAAVAEAGQMLAFEPPSFGDQATVGGMIATGLSGPRRVSVGAARDFVLGAGLLDARGQWMHFGGQVMKNVAGYDVSRLLCGSLGVLGVITEVSIKVLPLPARELTLALSIDQADALRALNAWAGKPLPISASAWCDGRLHIRLSGAAAAVRAAISHFQQAHGATEVDPAEAVAFWADVREHRHPMLARGDALWRLSVPSVAPVLAMPPAALSAVAAAASAASVSGDEPLIEWGGALRWYAGERDAHAVRAAAAAVGGTATLFRGGDKSVGVFPPLTAPVARVHARLKHEFDPNRLFNPGRLYSEL